MREVWQLKKLGEVGECRIGLTYSPDDVCAEGGTLVLRSSNVQNGRITYEDNVLVQSDVPKNVIVREGDILICVRNGSRSLIGKSAMISSADEGHAFGAFMATFRSQYGEYVFQLLQTDEFKRQVHRTLGATINQITNADLKSFKFLFPSLPEQRKIAAILRTWDEALEKLNALLTAKELQYRALARKHFEPCHPAFHGRPNTWREFELGDVFMERSQGGSDTDRLLSVTMNGGVIDREDVGRKDTSTADKSRYKLVLPGDIAYNTMRMWQGVAGLSVLRGIVSPAYTVVTPIETQILGKYAAHLFKSHRMVFDFERYSQGLTSDTWNLKFPAFSKIKLWLPPVEDQERLANLLDAMLEEQTVLRRQVKALTDQKRGLMQKLLKGEWPVEVSDDEEAAA